MEIELLASENAYMYLKLADFPKKKGKVIYRCVPMRDDKNTTVNLDYDKNRKLVGIEIITHGEQ
jgi:uncharacterized protein YuzE